jgi:hypothetical protein
VRQLEEGGVDVTNHHDRGWAVQVCAPATFGVAVAVAVLLAPLPADAKLGFGGGCGGAFCGYDSPATLRADGRSVRLTGHVTCDPMVEGWKLHVSVTQEATTASARVVIESDCKSGPIPFTADAEEVPNAPAFEPGKALACGLLLTGEGDQILHAGSWCRYVEIRKP